MLKHIQVVNASAGAKPYQLSDGNGLFLRIMPSGRKLWIVSKSINGERISKKLGDLRVLEMYTQSGLKLRKLKSRIGKILMSAYNAT